MYAKIFCQIFDSSIVENPETRFTFMDLLVLSDVNGIVDMTHESIARRTNRPIEIIRKTILELESPDTRSRTPDADGRRLKRLDDHRDWGWMIVNYDSFRKIASEEQRREKTAHRVSKYREKVRKHPPVTHSNAPVTHGNDSLRMKRHADADANANALVERERNFSEVPPMSRKDFDAMSALRGVPTDCAEWFWNVCDGRNWLDSTGQPIRKVEPLLLNAMVRWRQAAQPKRNGGNCPPEKLGKSLMQKLLEEI